MRLIFDIDIEEAAPSTFGIVGILQWQMGKARVAMRTLRDCYASLSRREQQVMALVVSGLLNKQVGGELGISEITVKAHRGNAMARDSRTAGSRRIRGS